MQRNWIGRSEGARVKFALGADSNAEPPDRIRSRSFTTRIDTIFGATFVLLGPEHPLVARFAERSADPAAFKQKAQTFRMQDRAARISGDIEKQGFDTGFRAINPFTGQPVSDLGGELRPRRLRHRRGHGRARARRARLRVRPQVQSAGPRRRDAGR